MGLKQAEKANANAKSSIFITLKEDNDESTMWLPFIGLEDADDPYVHEVVWDEKEDRSVEFTAEHKAAGKDPTALFRYNAIEKGGTKSAPTYTKKIFECKGATFTLLQELRAKYGNLDKFITVKRKGAAKSRKTKYLVMYDCEVTPEARELMEKFSKDRFDLKNAGKETEESSSSSSAKPNGNGSSGDAVLSDDQVAKLLPKLKELPSEKKNDFLKKFGIERVRLLKASDFDAAEKFIADAMKPADGASDAFS